MLDMLRHIFVLYAGLLLIPIISYAQENELEVADSAEVFLEEYSDEFQEVFFEALKQKSIENYDRAVNLLMECKRLEADNAVVDHELAKVLLVSGQLPLAQEYGMAAIRSLPENYWVLHTLVVIMDRQGVGLNPIITHLPYKNVKLRENLALIYFKQQNYEAALETLNGMDRSDFTRELILKIGDSLQDKDTDALEKGRKSVEEAPETNPIADYLSLISGFLEKNSFEEVETHSLEAMESFPTHPYFYYAYGVALNKKGQNREAIAVMESGLDFLVDDIELANKIYGELANANKALGNSSRANMYLSKIKSGL